MKGMMKESVQSVVYINKETFKSLYEQYWRKLFSYCYHKIGEKDETADMVQEIFLSLWRRREELGIHQIEHYLFRSATFEIADYYRSKKVTEKFSAYAYSAFSEADHSTEELLQMKILDERIECLITELPSKCREAYCLSRAEGKNYREISTIMGISENTVKSHLKHALGFLRQKLVLEGY